MKTIWPAATLALAVSGYFAWTNYSAPSAQTLQLDDCHRLAGQVNAIHTRGDAIPAPLLSTARGCTVAFGQNWAADGGERAAALRAEGASLVQ